MKLLDDLDVLKPLAVDEIFLLAVAILAVRGGIRHGAHSLPPAVYHLQFERFKNSLASLLVASSDGGDELPNQGLANVSLF